MPPSDRERLELERKPFEIHAEPKGYNLERTKVDKFDLYDSAYKNDAVDHEWHGWKARADLQVELMKVAPRKVR